MTKYLYLDLTQLGKISGGELQVAFALHNIIELTRAHIFLNSKFDLQIKKKKDYTFLYPLSFKKKNKSQK